MDKEELLSATKDNLLVRISLNYFTKGDNTMEEEAGMAADDMLGVPVTFDGKKVGQIVEVRGVLEGKNQHWSAIASIERKLKIANEILNGRFHGVSIEHESVELNSLKELWP